MTTLAENIVKTSIAIGRINSNIWRKDAAEEQLDFYEGFQIMSYDRQNDTPETNDYYFLQMPGEDYETYLDRMTRTTYVNITMMIINKLSYAYNYLESREVYYADSEGNPTEETNAGIELLNKLWKDFNFESYLHEALRKRRLLADVFAIPQYIPDRDTVEVAWWTPDKVDLIEDPDMPGRVIGVITTTTASWTGEVTASTQLIQTLYTESEIVKFIDGKETKREKHSYGMLPVVQFRNSEEWGDPWSIGLGPYLVAANKALNQDLSTIQENLHWQGFGIPVLEGFEGKIEDIHLGPGLPVTPPAGCNFHYESPHLPIMESLENIRVRVQAVMDTVGLRSKNPFSTSIENPASGVSMAIQEADVTEDMKSQFKRIAEQERQLALMILRVYGTHSKKWTWTEDQVDKLTVNISFRDPKPMLAIQDQLAQDTFDLEHGIKTAVDIYMERYNETDRDAAQAAIDENKASMREDEKQIMGPSPFGNMIPKQEEEEEEALDETQAE